MLYWCLYVFINRYGDGQICGCITYVGIYEFIYRYRYRYRYRYKYMDACVCLCQRMQVYLLVGTGVSRLNADWRSTSIGCSVSVTII